MTLRRKKSLISSQVHLEEYIIDSNQHFRKYMLPGHLLFTWSEKSVIY